MTHLTAVMFEIDFIGGKTKLMLANNTIKYAADVNGKTFFVHNGNE